MRWPDWADPNGRRSTTHFTSFDDGAAGISDYLWRLYEATHNRRFRVGALAGMRWLVAQARGPSCPESSCSWRWTDDPDWRVAYNGVGMGQAGVVLVLDAFADRTGDQTFRAYARAGAARLRELTENGTRPLPRGSESATHETGFLSGAAGAAYMFLERYRRDRDPADLATAHGLLRWVNDQAIADSSGGLRWPIADDDPSRAPGFELGAAGIAWVNLRAARTTGDADYARSRIEPEPGSGTPGGPGAVARARGRGDHTGPRRPRQRRCGDRLGPRGPRPGGLGHGCESTGRAVGAQRASA